MEPKKLKEPASILPIAERQALSLEQVQALPISDLTAPEDSQSQSTSQASAQDGSGRLDQNAASSLESGDESELQSNVSPTGMARSELLSSYEAISTEYSVIDQPLGGSLPIDVDFIVPQQGATADGDENDGWDDDDNEWFLDDEDVAATEDAFDEQPP
ncbi:hypothetical protein BGX28_002619, partial [Mortierella sp. GBA30]